MIGGRSWVVLSNFVIFYRLIDFLDPLDYTCLGWNYCIITCLELKKDKKKVFDKGVKSHCYTCKCLGT